MALRLPASGHAETLHTGIHAVLPVLPFMLPFMLVVRSAGITGEL